MIYFSNTIFYFCIIVFCMTTLTFGMSKLELSPKQIEEMISILHERKNPFPHDSHKKDIVHIIPAASEKEFTRITHFAPRTQQESNKFINNICAQYPKLRWFVTHTKNFNLEERLQEQGLKPLFIPTAMVRALAAIKCSALNNGLTIYQYPVDQAMVQYELVKDYESISKGTLFFHNDWVGIVNVETEKEHRRRGFATILMNHLLQTAYEYGARWALLEATQEALSLYKKLGFTEVMKTNIYNRE